MASVSEKNGTNNRIVAQPSSISQEESYLVDQRFTNVHKRTKKDNYDQLGVCNFEKEE